MSDRTKDLIILALAVILAGLLGQHGTHAAEAQSAQRWEYRCIARADSVADSLNQLGSQGWELVAAAGSGWGGDDTARASVQRHGATVSDLNTRMVWCLKRPL